MLGRNIFPVTDHDQVLVALVVDVMGEIVVCRSVRQVEAGDDIPASPAVLPGADPRRGTARRDSPSRLGAMCRLRARPTWETVAYRYPEPAWSECAGIEGVRRLQIP